MMTSEELEFDIREVMDEKLGLGRRMAACQRIADHDQAQRAVIKRYRKGVAAQAEDITTCVDDKLNGKWVEYKDHEQALAEKDREIQQIREHEFQRGYQEAEEKYQQLMVQTVLFAKATISDMITEGTVNKAKAFLKEREGT